MSRGVVQLQTPLKPDFDLDFGVAGSQVPYHPESQFNCLENCDPGVIWTRNSGLWKFRTQVSYVSNFRWVWRGVSFEFGANIFCSSNSRYLATNGHCWKVVTQGINGTRPALAISRYTGMPGN
jgi:hypothetical protein